MGCTIVVWFVFCLKLALMERFGDHGRIVKFIGICEYQSKLCIVMELMENGSLWDAIFGANKEKFQSIFTVEMKLRMVGQAAEGINHLHKQCVIHRDISARNFLIDSQYNVKIADLGMARLTSSNVLIRKYKNIDDSESKLDDTNAGDKTDNQFGPIRWMAPECIYGDGSEYSEKTDSYAFGITLFEIFGEERPFDELKSLGEVALAIYNGQRPKINFKIKSVGPRLANLMKHCWHENAALRPGFDNIIQDLKDIEKHWIKRWIIEDTIIGKGGFSTVCKGIDTQDSITVAFKFMIKSDKKAKETEWAAKNEISCLTKISHNNVIKLLGYKMNTKYKKYKATMFVLEYAPNGELTNLLSRIGAFSQILARTYFRQMISGLQACHDAGIVHRDIKPQNIVLDEKYNLKICDFGLSKLTKTSDLSIEAHVVGTPGFTAPEVTKQQDYNSLCDIFSAGVVLFVMLTKKRPFDEIVFKNKKSNKYEYDPKYKQFINENEKYWAKYTSIGINLTHDVKELLSSLLHFNPNARITLDKINTNEWYNNRHLQSHFIKHEINLSFLRSRRKKMSKKNYDSVDEYCKKILDNKNKLPFQGDLPSVPPNLIEELDDIYTTIDWRVVYYTISDFVKKHLKGSTKYQKEDNMLICSVKNPQDVTFSVKLLRSLKWNQNSKYSDTGIVYNVQMKRLSGSGLGFNKIKGIILNDKKYGFIFTGLPDWAASEAIDTLTKATTKMDFTSTIKISKTKAISNHNDVVYIEMKSNDDDKSNLDININSSIVNNTLKKPSKNSSFQFKKYSKHDHESFLSGLSQISDGLASRNSNNNITYYINDPLVAVLGIGDYDNDVMPPLIGVPQDYIQCIYTFYHKLGYSLVYQNKLTSKIEYLCKKTNNSKVSNQESKESENENQVSLRSCKENAKLHWIEDEIVEFVENVKETIVKNQHDSCIFIISAHGDRESVILDSKGEEVSVFFLFGQFNGKYCQYLVDKPKLIFVDACRGSMRAKPIKPMQLAPNDDKNQSSKNKKNIINKQNNINNSNIKPKNKKTQSIVNVPAIIDANKVNDKNGKILQNMIRIKDKYYHEQANFRYIYGNPDGYVIPDGGTKGGYLIRGIKRVFSNLDIALNKDLNQIVDKIRTQVNDLVGNGAMATVEDVNTMTYNVRFHKKLC